MNRRTLVATASALALSIAVPAAAQTLVATVGPTPGCAFTDLQLAIDVLSAEPADRRILQLERTTFEDVALFTDSDHLEIVGGFESCGDPEPSGQRTRLTGNGINRVLDVEPGFGGPRSFIRLANLVMENGRADLGGGLNVEGPVDVVLENTLILNNGAGDGGGVYLTDELPVRLPAPEGGIAGPTLTLTGGSGVNGNVTVSADGRGGGIACFGDGRVVGGDGSGLIGNEATFGGEGGGIYVQGCEVTLTGPFTIANNRARFGGGIRTEDARVRLRGTAAGAVRVINNTVREAASVPGAGGGIFLSGALAELDAENTVIDDNRALPETGLGQGGGIFVGRNALARLDRTLGAQCPGGAACSSLSGNRAARGAAAQVADGRLELRRTAVHGNVAEEEVLRAFSFLGPAEMRIESSTLAVNFGRSLFTIEDATRLEVAFSTAAGNLGLEEVIRARVFSGSGGEVSLATSILYDDAPGTEIFGLDPEVDLSAFCLVVPESAVLPDGPLFPDETATTDDPQLVDPDQGDLHLAPTSPAIDVCAGPGGVDTDLDLDLRGHDLPEVPDRFPGSVFDAGADELGPPGPIFADGFEAGDTSAWTASTP